MPLAGRRDGSVLFIVQSTVGVHNTVLFTEKFRTHYPLLTMLLTSIFLETLEYLLDVRRRREKPPLVYK